LLTDREMKPTARSAASRNGPWWLIVRAKNGRTEVLAVRPRHGQWTLPVFSFEEEAELFLQLGGLEDVWLVRESRGGELVSVLYGPCASVERVALDPLPEPWSKAMFDLCCVSRRDFVGTLTEGRRSP